MSAVRRNVYRYEDLRKVFDPQVVAVVGASPNATSAGARTIKQLELFGFKGKIYPVNSRYEKIGDRTCYPSVQALPEKADSVIINVNRSVVEEVTLDAAKAGAASAIIFAAGFSETGKAERIAEQDRLTAIGREANMRIIGPNCFGAVNFLTGAALTFGHTPGTKAELADMPRHDRRVGLASQSGGLGWAMVQSCLRGVNFSHVLTTGNSCDIDVADLVAFLAGEPGCKSIACLFEGISDPERMLQAAEIAWAANKPIIINKLGVGEQGATAAASHSGSLAGSHAAYLAAFERAGMTVVDNFENLIETASFFAKARPSTSRGVVALTSSGGASVMSADKGEGNGVPMPQPSPEVQKFLEAKLPDFATARNPCDVTGGVNNDPVLYFELVDGLLGDPSYDMMVTAHTFSVHTANRVKSFGELAKKHNKLVSNIWITEFLTGAGYVDAEVNPDLAVFKSMDRCFATIAAWYKREDLRKERAAIGPRKLERVAPKEAVAKAAALIDAAKNPVMTEREAKEVLATYGVPVVGEALTQSADEAVKAATSLGYPVAMKVESPDLPHKTEAGVIRLNLKSEAEVRTAYAEVMANANKVSPKPRLNGVLVQPMVSGGVEVIIGAKVDPLFGPLVIVGSGGVLVELMKDSAVGLAPVTKHEARGMIDKLKGSVLLKGFRKMPKVDLDKLADIIVRVSEFAADQRDRITELDINPLICGADRIVAVDALIARNTEAK